MKRASVRSREERDALVLQFYRLPFHVFRKIRNFPTVKILGQEDSIQVGFLHLIRAAELWEENRGVTFKTYAYKSVLSGMLHASQKKGMLPCPSCSFPMDYLLDYRSKQDELIKEVYGEGVIDAVNSLPPRLRRIILDTCLHGESYEKVGKKFNVCKQRIEQLRKKTLAWLKSYLSGEKPEKLSDPVLTDPVEED